MQLNQVFTITPRIQSLLNILEGQKTALSLILTTPTASKIDFKLPRQAPTNDLDRLACENLEKTYSWLISQQRESELDLDIVKNLHAKLLHNLRSDAGQLRSERTAIFNAYGQAVYLTPKPEEIEPLLVFWIKQIRYSQIHPTVQTIISHFQFEKIHPFKDGNGRLGRLILRYQLHKQDFDLHTLLDLESSIEDTKEQYLQYLESESDDVTSFVEYFLNLLTLSATRSLHKITHHIAKPKVGGALLPRRQEILNTIRDHSPCNVNFLQRRFMSTPASTLRYDLLKLQKDGYIKKLGVTNGALYSSVPTE